MGHMVRRLGPLVVVLVAAATLGACVATPIPIPISDLGLQDTYTGRIDHQVFFDLLMDFEHSAHDGGVDGLAEGGPAEGGPAEGGPADGSADTEGGPADGSADTGGPAELGAAQ